jgi:hypothetical protein
MEREQIERLSSAVEQAQKGMKAVGDALAGTASALSAFGNLYGKAVENELARRRAWREAHSG